MMFNFLDLLLDFNVLVSLNNIVILHSSHGIHLFLALFQFQKLSMFTKTFIQNVYRVHVLIDLLHYYRKIEDLP